MFIPRLIGFFITEAVRLRSLLFRHWSGINEQWELLNQDLLSWFARLVEVHLELKNPNGPAHDMLTSQIRYQHRNCKSIPLGRKKDVLNRLLLEKTFKDDILKKRKIKDDRDFRRTNDQNGGHALPKRRTSKSPTYE